MFMENQLKFHPYYATLAIVLIISIGFVSLMPSNGLPQTSFRNIDKLVHFSMYFILSISIALGFFKLESLASFEKFSPFLLAFVYSFLIEILQEFATNSRFFDIFDILANGIGCILAFVVLNALIFNKKIKN